MEQTIIFEPGEPVLVSGQPLDLPENLYIPPDALKVVLESFSGPLDLLLFLIRKQNIDILSIPIAEITEQYMRYVELMRAVNLELAAEYLLMAAILGEIKSRMLLPEHHDDETEEDPRAELIRRLQEYERFKKAADDLDSLPRMHRDVFSVRADTKLPAKSQMPDLSLDEILLAFTEVIKRMALFEQHQISREPLSVRERMSMILSRIQSNGQCRFSQCFELNEGKGALVVTLLAILEMVREQLIDIVQNNRYSEIYLQAQGQSV